MGEKVKGNKYLTLLLVIVAVYFFLKFICPLVAPVLVALLFLFALQPFLNGLQRKTHIRKNFLAAAILFFLCIGIGALIWILGCWLMQEIPVWIKQIDVVEQQFCYFVKDCCQTVESQFGIDAIYMENMILDQVTVFIDKLQLQIFPDMLDQSLGYAKNVVAVVGFLAVMIIAIVLLAKDYDSIMEKIKEKEECNIILQVAEKIIHYIVTFVKAQIIIMILIGVTIGTVLFLFQVNNGIAIGILAGFMDVLPFVGTGIVLIPLALWQLINGYYGKAVVCIILYITCALIRECLEPKLIGEKVGVYPIAILISVYAGLKLFGVWGILKGPLGFVIIQQTYLNLRKRWD